MFHDFFVVYYYTPVLTANTLQIKGKEEKEREEKEIYNLREMTLLGILVWPHGL